MKRILGMVCALAVCSSVFAAEQVINGGAENWTGSVPDGWMTDNIDAAGTVNATPGAFVISQTNAVVHSGTSAIQMVNAASQWTYRYGIHTNSFQIAGWSPTKAVSAWLYTNSSTANTRIARGFFSGGKWQVETTNQVAVAAANAWQNVGTSSWDLSTYPTRVSIHVINGPAITYIDDVSVDGTVPVGVSSFVIE